MQIRSDSFQPGGPIPAEFALGAPGGFGGNRNPHLAWDGLPEGTGSLVLLCVDPDAPTRPDMAGKEGVEIPRHQPRADFVHWAMADIPVEIRELAAGSCSDGLVKGGKAAPAGPGGARQGLNDYTGWFAGDPDMAGDYLGYDGPYPPPNDLRVHRYFFRLFALDVARLALPPRFGAGDALAAMQGHVLAEAAVHGTYSLNPAAAAGG
ncbi:YbhB/YbcL family Raf kinase inhibitor-like protein [Luteimonas sp. RD2P54]|uniref:YbhB/YbcL family Raf kinase inhibitor-like protein n=1 Tax=Luteimonas endophytica TaxID=3042023 RepID=A0ABT6J9L1_9GAMM|nr:YbhB/YbcL family Raf kinase inhibitor-like protein [Luteimonas endophytica]MDH5823282.1 YbhB/YbcL family Raf kinase inhibitor-like protein [Luteimonas endophytica]